nr:Chain D, DNA-directed RNA polymerase subunit beta' [Acetivibrio thermocellus DSM 1313]8I24_D Chain D, DNA-directed RNA polymerase subunit beta' [Acetivibrio thermocellus DSM 1313]
MGSSHHHHHHHHHHSGSGSGSGSGFELNNFDSIRIGLASPEKIREWSRGEVKKPETINYRTLKPERDGLFCERIFGPQKDWECHCGKYKRIRYKGIVCDRCGVEVTRSKVRRERMGHIELAAPVSHIWYFKGIPSRMGLLLDMSPRALEKILYFAAYVVIDPGQTPLSKKQILSEKEYRDSLEKFGPKFRAGMGAEAVRELLQEINLDELSAELREEIKQSTGQKRVRAIKRLEVVEAFRQSQNKPEWMILDVIPVIPPELRPMVQLDGGRFATSDLNDLYRRVINRNNRLKRLLDLGAPDIIVRNEKRMLQEAVDALIDNGRRGRPVTGPGNRPLKSLSDMLKGKQGRFRQNLLGKRVDYSGRSVIVVGPELKIYQCGLPKEMALELFKPFVMKKLVNDGLAHNIKSAKRMVERVRNEVWDVLEEVIKEHPVLLNRAPTLHRLGIQAFEPVLVEGRALKLHPLVCTAYNADFDGDQMAIHVPLSAEAQAEARFLMLSANNLLKPQDGKPVAVPTQDMVLGSYYLTILKEGAKGEGRVFTSMDEAVMAYDNGEIELHSKIKVRMKRVVDGVEKSKIIETTLGRLIFNEAIPQDLGFVDRSDPDKIFDLEVDFLVGKNELKKIIDKSIKVHGTTKTAILLDKIKELGFKYSTKGAITISISDMVIPEVKAKYIKETEEKIEKITKQYKRGLISDEERYNSVIAAWTEASENITRALINNLDRFNPVYMMSQSGARGNINQIKQLAGMRGLMADTSGKTIEFPIKANFREGLTVMEFFISTHGARKGLADTALRTADSGYLTRRLVDVSQDVIVRETDCGTRKGIEVTDIKDGNEVIEELSERIIGRYPVGNIVHPETGEIIVEAGRMITDQDAEKIVKAGIKKVRIRSVLTCHSEYGVCAKCYGANLATGEECNVGEAVGIIAAQSIGEPGTQLTMRTFHTGGVAGEDITQGLPRVEELFEARKPKGLAIISEIKGTVKISETKKKREIVVTSEDGETRSYLIPYGSRIKVSDGDQVEAGDELTEGSVNPHDILKIKGVEAVQTYLVHEVQKVYRMQGVDINDKHIEVIVRQMLRKVKVEDPGDTSLLPGGLVDVFDFEEENAKAIAEGKKPAVAKRALLGITKAALATDSFLSAASFQETTRVLTEAAIKGKVDPLVGLKENVIIGKLIPAGTGMSRYKDITISTVTE